MKLTLPLTVLLGLSLPACSGTQNSPEGVARRFVEAQTQGNAADMIKLVTDADRAAATLAPNTTDRELYVPDEDRPFYELFAKRVKVKNPSAQVLGDTTQVQVDVPLDVPDVDPAALMLGALFGGASDETQAKALLKQQIEQAPMKTRTETLRVVKVNGEWRVDTRWAERAEAKKQEDARRAKEQALRQVKLDYEQGVRQNLPQASAALKRLVKLYPNDKGWAQELAAVQSLLPRLAKFTVRVREAGIYQGQYRVVADVNNGSSVPLRSLTIKYTFLNSGAPVGEPQCETFTSGSWFSSRVLDVGGSAKASATGTPPAAWTGEKVRAEVTAYKIDAN